MLLDQDIPALLNALLELDNGNLKTSNVKDESEKVIGQHVSLDQITYINTFLKASSDT